MVTSPVIILPPYLVSVVVIICMGVPIPHYLYLIRLYGVSAVANDVHAILTDFGCEFSSVLRTDNVIHPDIVIDHLRSQIFSVITVTV